MWSDGYLFYNLYIMFIYIFCNVTICKEISYDVHNYGLSDKDVLHFVHEIPQLPQEIPDPTMTWIMHHIQIWGWIQQWQVQGYYIQKDVKIAENRDIEIWNGKYETWYNP